MSSSIFQAVPCWSALAVWLGKLDLCNWGEKFLPGVLSADEGMLDWIVLSVENGSTPREVMVWIVPSFVGLLIDLIKGGGAQCRLDAPIICVILLVVQGRFSFGVILVSVLECMPCVFVCSAS